MLLYYTSGKIDMPFF